METVMLHDTPRYRLSSLGNGATYCIESKPPAHGRMWIRGQLSTGKFRNDLWGLEVGREGRPLAIDDALHVLWLRLREERELT